MTLVEFVDLCNNCSKDIMESSLGLDKPAKQLGNRIIQGLFSEKDDKDDKEFYDSLVRRGYTNSSTEYKFLQNEFVIAKIPPFVPFVNIDKQILSQKWHILISVLAYLDTASFDEKANMADKFNIGNIKDIEIDSSGRKVRVIGEKRITSWYTSISNNKLLISKYL